MRAFTDIAPYAVDECGRGYAVYKGPFRMSDVLDCEGDAYGLAHAFLDEDEEQAEIEAAEQAELEAAIDADDAELLTQIARAA